MTRSAAGLLLGWMVALPLAAASDPVAAFVRQPAVRVALEQLRADDERTFREQVELSGIPAPPFGESRRAQEFAGRLRAAGIADVTIDTEGNVIGRRPGTGQGPLLVLSAHLDTVYPEGTDLSVSQREGRHYGAGLLDDARGLAAVLAVARAVEAAKLRTRGDLWFVATVGEEGLGDLRGVKALFRDHGSSIDGFISIDGADSPSGEARIVNQATGSRRWQISFIGPGGHSFGHFGRPSATHAMGRAIAAIADLVPPLEPKTTFTVGTVAGGTAVNAIAADATMLVDIRSDGAEALADFERRLLATLDVAAAAENARWGGAGQAIRVERLLVGDRPASAAAPGNVLQHAALGAFRALGRPEPTLGASSTDSNVAMGLGIPALTLGGGGRGDGAHSPQEWYQPVEAWVGPQVALLTALSAVGVQGGARPTLPRAARH